MPIHLMDAYAGPSSTRFFNEGIEESVPDTKKNYKCTLEDH